MAKILIIITGKEIIILELIVWYIIWLGGSQNLRQGLTNVRPACLGQVEKTARQVFDFPGQL